MVSNKYIGVYYSDTVICNPKALATFCLFFDEIHLISPSDDAKDPTTTYKNLPDKFFIHSIGQSRDGDKRILDFYKFVSDIKPLLKEVVYYHQHLLNTSTSQFIDKLLCGNLSSEDFTDFIFNKTPELQAMRKFNKENPNIEDDMVFNAASTSLQLVKDNDWILIGDDKSTPMPVLSKQNKTVKQLTSILAEECINIALPECCAISAEQILEAREKLRDQLIPFRMSMQKMSLRLKELIKENQDYSEIKQEAKFLAQSEIEPSMFEIKRRIEREKDKFWIKVFGKIMSWIPFVANSFLAPTPNNIKKTIEKIYSDTGDLADAGFATSIPRESGISFLLSIENIIGNKNQ